MDHDLEKARNMKLLLTAFEQLSGLKINFHKSEVFCYGEATNYEEEYMDLFGYNMGGISISLFGDPHAS
jgi:hypothetical protein